MELLKFVIAGHVDHGKSTLIGRLLFDTDSLPPDRIEEIEKSSQDLGKKTEFAYLLDCLEEERRQGITIETTQVFFKAGGRLYIIIDVPGHAGFVKNMITGASHAGAAVLIIDIKEGIKEQTRRHAYILSFLGINQVIVAINKMDLADYDKGIFERVRRDMNNFLDDIDILPVSYIPISALKGENIRTKSEKMPWHRGPTFLQSLEMLKNTELPENKPLIFPVQDVYKVAGRRIAAGRLETGIIRKGQPVKVLPCSRTTKVKSIEKYPHAVDKASAGESVGIVTEHDMFLNRGDIICEQGGEPLFADYFDANIFWLSKHNLHRGEGFVIRCATQETACKIGNIRKRIDSSTLEIIEENADMLRELELGEVSIQTQKPMAIKPFNEGPELGRFVLVKDGNTCAGGIVTSKLAR